MVVTQHTGEVGAFSSNYQMKRVSIIPDSESNVSHRPE